MDGIHHLRVLIANQWTDRLELLAEVVTGLGHEVIAREIHVSDVAAVTARERPDVALVGLGESAEHALQQISEIVAEAFCPVIALLDTYDGGWVNEAASRGVFAYIVDSRPEELQSAIDITLRRFGDYQHLQGAFERRNAETDRETERVAGAAAAGARAPRQRRAVTLGRPPRSRARPARGVTRGIAQRSREHPCDRQQITRRAATRGSAASRPDPRRSASAELAMSDAAAMNGDIAAGVLICDDNDAMRTLLGVIVDGSLGLRVVGEATDGNEAVAEATRLQPNVILLDLAMPNRSGLEALPELRQVAPDARIIVFSGFAGSIVAEQVLALGAASYLEKGAHPDTIVATIEQALASTNGVPTSQTALA